MRPTKSGICTFCSIVSLLRDAGFGLSHSRPTKIALSLCVQDALDGTVLESSRLSLKVAVALNAAAENRCRGQCCRGGTLLLATANLSVTQALHATEPVLRPSKPSSLKP